MRDKIKDLIALIVPFDEIEKAHISESSQWISSGVEIFRIKKPDIPPKHLVSYFVLIDIKKRKLLLINHIKAGLWLPPGGHIEKNEDPANTVKREIQEELGTRAHFIVDKPFFITVTETINIDAGHIDVSLWYLLKGDSTKEFVYNKKEMSGYQWFGFEDILKSEVNLFDPHMRRFIKKLLPFLF